MHELSNILTQLIFILLHFFVFLGNYAVVGRKIFAPPVIFSLLWTVVISLHLIFGVTVLDELFPISIETYLVMLTGVITFSLASFIVAVNYQQSGISAAAPLNPQQFKLSLSLRLIFIFIVIVGLPLYVQASIRVFLASKIDNFLVGLRTELSYGDEDIGPTKYLITLSFVVFSINYYASLKEGGIRNKILAIISFLATIIYAVLATGRSYFFIILAIYLGINYFHQKSFSLKKYVLALGLFMLVFITFGMIFGKGGEFGNSLKDNLEASTQTTGIYLISSISALDHEIQHNVNASYPGEYSLRFFVKIGQQLNMLPNKKVSSVLSEFVFIPYPTNVYTIYSPYIRDFGKIYAWFMIALFGALHTRMYYKTEKTPNLRNTLYYSFLLFPLLLSFFQDQYMSLFSFWLQIIFYIELFIILNRVFMWRKQ